MVSLTLKQIEDLVMKLPIADREALLERLAHSVASPRSGGAPCDLYGDWRGRFPEDFDINAALRESRERWRQGDAA